MKSSRGEITVVTHDTSESMDVNLACSLSLAEIDYFDFYMEKRATVQVRLWDREERDRLSLGIP